MSQTTHVLTQLNAGDPSAATQLLPLVYDELRKLAAFRLAHERSGNTLQPTALVHEAYLRLVTDEDIRWDCRAHFFGAAVEAIRRILIDAARKKGRQKRGGGQERLELALAAPLVEGLNFDLLALDEALTELCSIEPQKGELVKLRYFGGLTLDEAAETLRISASTADRYGKYARAWLASRLRDDCDHKG